TSPRPSPSECPRIGAGEAPARGVRRSTRSSGGATGAPRRGGCAPRVCGRPARPDRAAGAARTSGSSRRRASARSGNTPARDGSTPPVSSVARGCYRDGTMSDDEHVVFETRLHPAYLTGTLVFAACVVGATALVVHRNPLETKSILQLWLAALVVIALASAAPLYRWWSSRFSVSTQRLTILSGGLRVQRIEIPL